MNSQTQILAQFSASMRKKQDAEAIAESVLAGELDLSDSPGAVGSGARGAVARAQVGRLMEERPQEVRRAIRALLGKFVGRAHSGRDLMEHFMINHVPFAKMKLLTYMGFSRLGSTITWRRWCRMQRGACLGRVWRLSARRALSRL